MLERINVGDKPVPAVDLLKWCMENGFAVHFHPPHKERPQVAYINMCTKAREAKYLPVLAALGWKHFHHPPSNSPYKSVGFTDIVL